MRMTDDLPEAEGGVAGGSVGGIDGHAVLKATKKSIVTDRLEIKTPP